MRARTASTPWAAPAQTQAQRPDGPATTLAEAVSMQVMIDSSCRGLPDMTLMHAQWSAVLCASAQAAVMLLAEL